MNCRISGRHWTYQYSLQLLSIIFNNKVKKSTLLGKIMTCFFIIMAEEIMGGEKYGGISPKPPIFPGHNLPVTYASQNFSKISREFTRFFMSQMHLPAL